MPRYADGPKMSSQPYYFVPDALRAELTHAMKDPAAAQVAEDLRKAARILERIGDGTEWKHGRRRRRPRKCRIRNFMK
jgi:hypothetical protein